MSPLPPVEQGADHLHRRARAYVPRTVVLVSLNGLPHLRQRGLGCLVLSTRLIALVTRAVQQVLVAEALQLAPSLSQPNALQVRCQRGRNIDAVRLHEHRYRLLQIAQIEHPERALVLFVACSRHLSLLLFASCQSPHRRGDVIPCCVAAMREPPPSRPLASIPTVLEWARARPGLS